MSAERKTARYTPREIIDALAANRDVEEIDVVRTLDRADTELAQAEADGYTLRSTIETIERTNETLRRNIEAKCAENAVLRRAAGWMRNFIADRSDKGDVYMNQRDALQWSMIRRRLDGVGVTEGGRE